MEVDLVGLGDGLPDGVDHVVGRDTLPDSIDFEDDDNPHLAIDLDREGTATAWSERCMTPFGRPLNEMEPDFKPQEIEST